MCREATRLSNSYQNLAAMQFAGRGTQAIARRKLGVKEFIGQSSSGIVAEREE
jgi:hypothetical protein